MSGSQSFGDTISSGIQDIAALLPLLGTEQCERHVGTALEKGFLYASAAPLSIFGSLGIVKTSFATFVATVTHPFYGGKWLNDAGFSTPGSTSSMVTIAKGTKQYGAEVNLQNLLNDQHIDDPHLVSDVEWFGWGKKRSTNDVDAPSDLFLSWNFQLILSAILGAILSVSPYLYLIHNRWESVLPWIFPLLRSCGSLSCVVSVQLALQLRIHHITKSSLLLLQARRRYPLPEEQAVNEREIVMEERLRNLALELESRLVCDPEKPLSPQEMKLIEEDRDILAARLSRDWRLQFLQLLLPVGMGMIVAGYVGCFNLVSRSGLENGPYVWFGMETALALLRILLWGWNPSFHGRETGMTMRLELRDKGPGCGGSPVPSNSDTSSSPLLNPCTTQLEPDPSCHLEGPFHSPKQSADSLFPLITTPHHLSRLSSSWLREDAMWGWRKDHRESFIIETAEDFLATATSYIGPLRRLKIENISLFYSIVPYVEDDREARKLLCTTALHNGSNASVSIFTGGSKTPHAIYSSYCDDLAGTRALQANLENDISDYSDSTEVLDTRTFGLIIEHSYNLFSRLFGGDTYSNLDLLWTLKFPTHITASYPETVVPLTRYDKEYMRLCQTYDLKGDYCSQRGTLIIGVFSPAPAGSIPHELLLEYGVIMESAILEIHLCCIEHDFARVKGLPSATSRRLTLEWIRKMKVRIDVERRQCEDRSPDLPTGTGVFCCETWDSLALELRALRLLPPDSPVLQKWREHLHALLTTEEGPNVSELFELKPFCNMRHLEYALLPVFTMHDTTVQTQIYHNMVGFLRPTLQRLRDSHPPDLFDRIDVYGPVSAEFSPPHMSIRKATTRGVATLAEQINLIQTLQIFDVPLSGLLDLLNVLDSNSQPPTTLSTLSFHKIEEVFREQDNPVVQLIYSILAKNDNIICTGFDDCRYVDIEILKQLEDAIQSNREKWIRRAQGHDQLIYHAGIQFNHCKEYHIHPLLANKAFSIYKQDVLLTEDGEIFALVYIPGHGKIVPVVSLMLDHVDIYVTAKLQRSTAHDIFDNDDDIPEIESSASVSSGQRTLQLDGFPDVYEGCYELRIWIHEGWYLFKEVRIDYVPVTGEQANITQLGILEAEERVMSPPCRPPGRVPPFKVESDSGSESMMSLRLWEAEERVMEEIE